MRSNDAVFGFDNDALWHRNVQILLASKLAQDNGLNREIVIDPIIWNAGSLHIYERHFKFLES